MELHWIVPEGYWRKRYSMHQENASLEARPMGKKKGGEQRLAMKKK
jgi:hypothetical protein